MNLTIKKNDFGYYVDQRTSDDERDPKEYYIFLEFNQPGVTCPLPQFATMKITDNDGRKLIIRCRDENIVTIVQDETGNRVDEFTLDVDHGFWFFVNGKLINDYSPGPHAKALLEKLRNPTTSKSILTKNQS